jgi:MFS family permease
MYSVAIQLMFAKISTNAEEISAVRAVTMLPPAVFVLLAGAVADQAQRRRIMIVADLTRAGLVLALATFVATGVAQLWSLYLVILSLGCAGAFFDSASQALLPQVVGTGDLERANGWLISSWTLGRSFIGPAFGGFVFAIAPSLPFFADAASFVASAALVMSIRMRTVATSVGTARPNQRGMWRSILSGFKHVVSSRLLIALMSTAIIVNLAVGITASIFVIYALRVLVVSPKWYGALLIGESIGALSGSFLAAHLGGARRKNAVVVALVTLGCVYLTQSATRSPWIAFIEVVVGNVAYMCWVIIGTSLRQAVVAEEIAGRITGFYRLCGLSAQGVGAIVSGLFVQYVGIREAIMISGVVALLAVVPILTIRQPGTLADEIRW